MGKKVGGGCFENSQLEGVRVVADVKTTVHDQFTHGDGEEHTRGLPARGRFLRGRECRRLGNPTAYPQLN